MDYINIFFVLQVLHFFTSFKKKKIHQLNFLFLLGNMTYIVLYVPKMEKTAINNNVLSKLNKSDFSVTLFCFNIYYNSYNI